MSPFQKATRRKAKARIALSGASGSGKTFTALMFAQELASGGPVAVIDTENESASLYADEFNFDTAPLAKPYSPARYIELIHEAEKAGYAVIVIDSLSHAWFAEGGVLDIVDKAKAASRTQDGYAAWRKGTPEQNKLLEALVWSPAHIIVTLRSKQEYVIEKDEKTGKTKINKIGLAPVQRDGLEYEFTIAGEIDLEHTLVISKSRMHSLADMVISRPTAAIASQIKAWLEEGAVALPHVEPTPTTPPAPEPVSPAPIPSADTSTTPPAPIAENGQEDPRVTAINLRRIIPTFPGFVPTVHRDRLGTIGKFDLKALRVLEAEINLLYLKESAKALSGYDEVLHGPILESDDQDAISKLLADLKIQAGIS